MVRAADERGDNSYLEWRAWKKDFLIDSRAKDGCPRENLREFMVYTWNNFHEIQEDRKVVEARDPYRENGRPVIKFDQKI